jgi:hypothetical protein
VPRNPIVPNVLMIEFLWTQTGVPCANVMHAQYEGGPPSGADLEAIAEEIATAWWAEALYSIYSNSTVFVGIRITDLNSDTGAVGEFSEGGGGTGEEGTLPAQACVLTNITIARRYRGGHPRIYFPPPQWDTMDSATQWKSTTVSTFTTAVTALQASLSSASNGSTVLTSPVCVSYRDGDDWRVDNLVEPWTGFSVSPIVATQRRRVRSSSY